MAPRFHKKMPAPEPRPATKSEQIWDEKLQEYHGGQDWNHLPNLVEDLSVTTNGLGTPQRALESMKSCIDTVISHYPAANNEPALSHLARFLWPDDNESVEHKSKLMLGNGASELIDLVVRCAPVGPFKPGPTRVQYKEYERSAQSHGRIILPAHAQEPPALFCLVNPTNPTGEYMSVETIKQVIERECRDGPCTVIVDESMQMWLGPEWRQDSLTSQHEWIRAMSQRRNVHVFVMHSWTKIWSCTGLRLGSVVCPTAHHAEQMKRIQVPWSVNAMAQVFLTDVAQDEAFMDLTWAVTPQWNQTTRELVTETAEKLGLDWVVHGEPFLSWLWVDVGDETVAARCVESARRAGVPVRWGKYGYAMPRFVRIAVRSTDIIQVLMTTWCTEFQPCQ